jgi:hypothetical protein
MLTLGESSKALRILIKFNVLQNLSQQGLGESHGLLE